MFRQDDTHFKMSVATIQGSAETGGSAYTVVWRVSRQNEIMIPDGHIVFSKRSTGYETFILMANGDQSDYRHGNHADRQRNMALN